MTASSSQENNSIEKRFKRPGKKQEILFSFSAFFILLFGLWGYLQFYLVSVLLIPIFLIPVIYLIYSSIGILLSKGDRIKM